MTVRAVELLKKADVVIHDRLIGVGIEALIPKHARRIDAGKSGVQHNLDQAEINDVMVELASSGKTVVRLKGGDPYLFGRGAEEAEFLTSRGIAVEVVPGVTSAISVPALAGIPVTHRDIASVVTIVTGHDSPQKRGASVDWGALARLDSTIVVLMGVKNLGRIAKKLMSEGKSGTTPVAVIERGTWQDPVVTVGNLRNISRMAKEANVKPPAIIVIGDIVRLRERLEEL